MTPSRRALAAAARRMRDDPRSAVEVVGGLIADDADAVEMTARQVVALVWWCATHDEALA